MRMHRAAALTVIVAVAVGSANSNPLDREIGNASIQIEHFHQEPRDGNKHFVNTLQL